MVEPGPGRATWLAVLPPRTADETLSELSAELASRGWSCESSRGREQVVLAVSGPQSAAQLDSLLAPRARADVIPLLEAGAYRRLQVRRRFLGVLVSGLGLLIVLGLALPLVGYLAPPAAGALAPELLYVGPRDDLAVGQARLVRFDEQPVLVIRDAEERWLAVSASCTYMDDCLLAWEPERALVVCACHGCAFDPHGNPVHPPASIPLLRLEAVPQGQGVYVRRLL